MLAAVLAAVVPAAIVSAAMAAAPKRACTNPDAIGLARTVVIDAAKGQVYGSVTQAPTNDILHDKEVLLTFDDGPYPGLSRQILDTLDRHCTKATFFLVGQMAVARPELVREEIARGHTVGSHTWSHPMPMKALTPAAQIEEIDRGVAAVARVAGRGLAPFFRFPGLGDSPETLAHLKARGIATFTVDVVSNDTMIADPVKLAGHTLNILDRRGRGILLFHDIKPVTAAMLPVLLAELQRRGYRVVHVVPKGPGPGLPVRPLPTAGLHQPTPPGVERFPWGLSHPGPIPTILPLGPARASTVDPQAAARPVQAGPQALPSQNQGPSANPGKPQPPARTWPAAVFGGVS